MSWCGRVIRLAPTAAPIGAAVGLVACVTAAEVGDDGSRTRHFDAPPDSLTTLVLANAGPTLLDFGGDATFLIQCEPTVLRAVLDEDDGSSLDVTWKVYGPRAPSGAPGPLAHTASATYDIPPGPVQDEMSWACRQPGTYDVLLVATDDGGATSSFDTALQCIQPRSGVCLDGGAPVGAVTCDPTDWVLLDPTCVSLFFGTVPSCDALCPPGAP